VGEKMKTMYKEEFTRKRLPVILELVALLTVTVFISDLLEKIIVADRSIGFVTNPLLVILVVVMIILSIEICKEKYRYSIIADQLIVHRIMKGEQFVVENIKLSDIKYLGREANLKDKLNDIKAKRHGCSLFSINSFCCIYKKGSKVNKFYFSPSEVFSSRLSSLLESEKQVSDIIIN
jgi:hypothetical protein